MAEGGWFLVDGSFAAASAGPGLDAGAVVPTDPIPAGWPKDWRRTVEEFRSASPEAFGWSCDWHGSDRAFRKACARAFAVLELRHGSAMRHVDWVLISVRDELWQAFLAELRALPSDRQERIGANLALCNPELAAQLTDRRVQRALEAAGGRTSWNTLEPFDRRLSFAQLADGRHLVPELVQVQFDDGLSVEVTFGRPAGCRLSVVDENAPSKSSTLYEQSVLDGDQLDAAVREAVRLLLGRPGAGQTRHGGQVLAAPQPSAAAGPFPLLADDAASHAAQISRGWIRRTHHCPMRPTLVQVEDTMAMLETAVASGRIPPGVSIDVVRAEADSPFGRWVRSDRAFALDPARAAETRSLNATFHLASAEVLTAVRDGHSDRARLLLEAEAGCAGAARRLDEALRSWVAAHCDWSADGAVDHAAVPLG